MNSLRLACETAAVLSIVIALPATAQTTVYYGDDDGFGIGAISGLIDPTIDNASLGEAAFTDVRLIGSGVFVAPAFQPTGSFGAFAPTVVTSALLTLRLGSFTPSNPVDGPNEIYLNGLLVDPSFIDGFVANVGGTNFVETRSIVLDSSFFSTLSTGNVSLAGTRISEGSGFGSFQVDFLRLDLNSIGSVPEPATWAMLLLGFFGLGGSMRMNRKKQHVSVSYV